MQSSWRSRLITLGKIITIENFIRGTSRTPTLIFAKNLEEVEWVFDAIGGPDEQYTVKTVLSESTRAMSHESKVWVKTLELRRRRTKSSRCGLQVQYDRNFFPFIWRAEVLRIFLE